MRSNFSVTAIAAGAMFFIATLGVHNQSFAQQSDDEQPTDRLAQTRTIPLLGYKSIKVCVWGRTILPT